MLTPKEYAKEVGVKYVTVMSWIYNEWLDGVEFTVRDDRKFYLIPQGTPRPPVKRGRPKTETTH